MKDFVGKELQHNDLVVSKPAGRYATMRFALIRDELAGVWFKSGSVGGSDIIKIDVVGYPDLEQKQKQMIDERIKELVDREQTKVDNKNTRIKKKDFKRFGVYSDKTSWGQEIFLGCCEIDGKIVENVWMEVTKPYAESPTKENTSILFWRECGYYQRGRFRASSYRSVKYPQKFTENFVLTKDEIDDIISLSFQKLKEQERYHHQQSADLIKIIF